MDLSHEQITKIARLARLAMTDEEKDHYGRELSRILDWIETLSEVNTDHVPPMVSVTEAALPWRTDQVTDGNQPEAVLANATGAGYGCFMVPKVIE